jgi:hypothetical protein
VKKLLVVGTIGVVLSFGIMMLGACDLDKNKKTCDDENNCSAANNMYYCGRSSCAANDGYRCSCD